MIRGASAPMVDGLAHQVLLDQDADAEHEGDGDDEAQDGIDAQHGEDRVGSVSAQHDEIAVGEVDESHDPEDHGQDRGPSGRKDRPA